MSRILGSSGLYNETVIDDRNQRPLAIAFATIVLVWTLAFGVVSVSAGLGAQSRPLANGAPVASTIAK
jgi:hypothetical protein